MNKLKMKLISNGEVKLEGESNYQVVNNKMIFRVEESNYFIDLNKKTFEKRDIDTNILIDINEKVMFLKLVNHPGSIDLELTKSSFESENNQIKIHYSYFLEEKMDNIIDINLY